MADFGEHDSSRLASERTKTPSAIELRADPSDIGKSELGFHALSEAAFEAVTITDEGRILFANHALADMFGYKPAEVIGMLATDFAAPESREIVKSHIISGSEEPYEARGVRKDGSTFTAMVRGKMIQVEGRRLRVTAISDLTHQKQIEAEQERVRAALEENHRNDSFLAEVVHRLGGFADFYEAVAALPSLVVPYLADWAVAVVRCPNQSFRVFAAAADAKKAPLAEAICRFTPDPEAPSGVALALRSGQTVVANDVTDEKLTPQQGEWSVAGVRNPELLRIVRALGMRAFIAVPLVARGNALGAIGLVSSDGNRSFSGADVNLVENLAHRAALCLDNARLLADARDAIRVRDEFLSIASHELRTPITSLQLAVQNIARTTQAADRADVPREILHRLAETAGRQTRRLDQLVDTLLDVSRMGSDNLVLDRGELDLGDLIREIVGRLSEDSVAAGSPIHLELRDAVVGNWDRSRIDQVVTNLLSNALKFGAGKPIQISATQDDGVAEFKVSDRGIGIRPAEHDRVFELFERAVSPKHFGGLGLGLYIARRIVESHSGTLTVTSDQGAGATFTVRLPVRPLTEPNS